MSELTEEQFPCQIFDGITVPNFVRTREAVREGFKIRPDTDIIVATYQKSGTTWTQNILRHLLWPEDNSDTPLHIRIPWVNVSKDPTPEKIEALPNPRVLKTHDPAEWLDDIVAGTNAKIVFVYRNPKDVSVSFYRHMMMKLRLDLNLAVQIENKPQSHSGDVEFQDFFRNITRNPARCPYGLWETHLSGYLAQRNKRNMLVLRFEDMKQNLPREIRKIADFVGVQYDDDIIEDVAKKTDFNYMKNDKTCNYSDVYKSSDFMRSGKVGSWQGFLTEDQAAELDEIEKQVYEKFGLKC